MYKILITDLMRKIDENEFWSTIGNIQDYQEIYAFTPLAEYMFNKGNIKYKSLEQLINYNQFHKQGLENCDIAFEIIKNTLGNNEENFGLFFRLKVLLDFFYIEYLKRKSIASLKGNKRLITTSKLPTHATNADLYLNNEHSLYYYNFEGLDISSLNPIYENRQRIVNVKRFIYKIKPNKLYRHMKYYYKILSKMNRMSIYSKLDYDWLLFTDRFRKKYKIISKLNIDNNTNKKIREPDINRFPAFVSSLPFASDIISSEIMNYDKIKNAIRINLPMVIEKNRLKAAFLTIALSYYDFLVAYFLKRNKIKTFFYQHGAYFNPNEVIYTGDLVPADVNFVYGGNDEDNLGKRVRNKICCVGSALFSSFKITKESNNIFIYILNISQGNFDYVFKNCYPISSTSLWLRHKRVIDLFSKYPQYRLILKVHPSSFRKKHIYFPYYEYISDIKAKNISINLNPWADDYLDENEYVILDYVSTALLQVVAKKKRKIIVYVGKPYKIIAGIAKYLSEFAEIVYNDDVLIEILTKILNGKVEIKVATDKNTRKFREKYLLNRSKNQIIKHVISVIESELSK